MKNHVKRILTALLAVGLVTAMPLAVCAAELEADETAIYEEEAETVATANIENAPSLRSSAPTTTPDMTAPTTSGAGTQMTDGATVETDGTTEGTTITPSRNDAPNTGVPDLLLPIGTALLALSAMPLAISKRK